jgi:hypothetical protein
MLLTACGNVIEYLTGLAASDPPEACEPRPNQDPAGRAGLSNKERSSLAAALRFRPIGPAPILAAAAASDFVAVTHHIIARRLRHARAGHGRAQPRPSAHRPWSPNDWRLPC